MRIMHVLDSLEVGGAQRVAIRLAERTIEAGHEVSICAGRSAVEVDVPGEVELFRFSCGGFIGHLLQLALAVRVAKPGILHAHQRREALLANIVGRIFRIPTVEHAHTLLPRRSLKRLSFRSDVIFAVSDTIKQMLETDFSVDAKRVHVTLNAPGHVSATPPTAHGNSRGRGLRIIGVGRLEEQKNPFRFIDIIAAVSKSTAIEARWVGDGSLYESAKSYAERLSAPIEFVGYRPNVIAELDRADGILITSSWEGLPLVALEAMARKRPVVGSRVGGLPALLDEGRGLLLTENADLNADAELCIDGFTASPATSARTESAFMYVRERLSPERVFDPILEVYCSVGKDR